MPTEADLQLAIVNSTGLLPGQWADVAEVARRLRAVYGEVTVSAVAPALATLAKAGLMESRMHPEPFLHLEYRLPAVD